MLTQQAISLTKNREFVGRSLEVLIEGVGQIEGNAAIRDPAQECGNCVSIGRSYRDAPEVDGIVIVQDEIPIGKLVRVKITSASEYDLIAQPV
jgi:ribosomal protein S12 methylthiotransferase